MSGSFAPKHTLFAAVILACCSSGVHAADFTIGDSVELSVDTTVSLGQGWRTEDRDPLLIGSNAGARIGIVGFPGVSTDDANANYGKGDTFTRVLKFVTDIEARRGKHGAVVRVKGWYDDALQNDAVPWGNFINQYVANTSLGDDGFDGLSRFSGIEVLDAFYYGNYELGGTALNLRVGEQVVNWGESLFIRGNNLLNPVDVPALRRPGAEVKEALLPMGSVLVALGFSNGWSLDVNLPYNWRETLLDQCGTMFATLDGTATHETVQACASVSQVLNPGAGITNETLAVQNGFYIPFIDTDEASDGGQWAVALRLPGDLLGGDFGIYASNLHMTTPVASGDSGAGIDANQFLAFTPNPTAAQWEYVEDIETLGLSYATTLAGWSVGVDFSHVSNYPVQVNANDLLAGLVTFAQPVPTLGAARNMFTGVGPDTHVNGYVQVAKDALVVNFVQAFTDFISDSTTVIAEIGYIKADIDDATVSNIRYGRSFVFGRAPDTTLISCGATASAVNLAHPGCAVDGFFTSDAFGYRLLFRLRYNEVMSGWNFQPRFFFAHDVDGVSVDNQMIEGRLTMGLGLRLEKNDKGLFAELGMTRYSGGDYDPLHDRDNAAFTLGTTF